VAIISLDGQRFLSVSWRDVEGLVDTLFGQISEGYWPDTVVGVLRGGVIVANLLSDLLGTQEVFPVGCRAYRDDEREDVRIYHDLSLRTLVGRKVLLVDDCSDSGGTLTTAMRYLINPRTPDSVKTATLHIKPWTSFKPDFFVESTDAWILYPWERLEAVRILSKRRPPSVKTEAWVKELSRLARLKEDMVRKAVGASMQASAGER